MKQTRLDRYFDFDRTTAFKETPEGFLIGRAVLTNVGVFPYLQKDGSTSWELRPPEEVFSDATMESLRGKPLTNDHPSELVTPENFREYAVGSIGEGISRDEYHLVGTIVIQDKDAIAAVRDGKRGVSCGYTLNVTDQEVSYDTYDWEGNPVKKVYPCPGVWMGVPYNAIQTNIVNNHAALVNRGRAGDDARIRIDGVDGVQVQLPTPTQKPKGQQMKKIRLDNGLEYEVAPEVAVGFEALGAKVTALDKALEEEKTASASKDTESRANLDAANERVKELEAKLADEPKRLDAAVKARALMVGAAAKAGVELKGDESEHDIKVAVIKVVSPKANLDGEPAEYIAFRFKMALESLNADGANHTDSTDVPGGRGSEVHVDAEEKQIAKRDEARQNLIKSYTKN